MNKFKKFFSYFFGKEKTMTFQDIFLCVAVSLTASFLFYEGRSANLTKMIFSDIVITILVFAVWGYCGFVSGRRKSVGFPIFGFLYWCAPYLFLLYYAARDNVHNYVKWLSFANRIGRFLYERPFAGISHTLGVTPFMVILLLIVFTGCSYSTGVIITRNKAEKNKIKDEIIEEENDIILISENDENNG